MGFSSFAAVLVVSTLLVTAMAFAMAPLAGSRQPAVAHAARVHGTHHDTQP